MRAMPAVRRVGRARRARMALRARTETTGAAATTAIVPRIVCTHIPRLPRCKSTGAIPSCADPKVSTLCHASLLTVLVDRLHSPQEIRQRRHIWMGRNMRRTPRRRRRRHCSTTTTRSTTLFKRGEASLVQGRNRRPRPHCPRPRPRPRPLSSPASSSSPCPILTPPSCFIQAPAHHHWATSCVRRSGSTRAQRL